MSEDNRNDNQQTMALLNKPVFNFLRYPTTYVTLLAFAAAVADLGGCGGAAAPPLASFRKNSWSTNFENSEDRRQHDYYCKFLPCS